MAAIGFVMPEKINTISEQKLGKGAVLSNEHSMSQAAIEVWQPTAMQQAKPSHLLEHSMLSKSHLVVRQDKSPAEWVQDNILRPAYNTALGEPSRAFRRLVNESAQLVGSENLLAEQTLIEAPKCATFSTQWFAQNISSGLAMVVPYGIAGFGTSKMLRAVGAGIGAEGATAKFLQSRETATILGAALYDGFRVPHEGETRLGNAAAGASAFYVFERGNGVAKLLETPAQRLTTRVMTGALGGLTQLTVSSAVSRNQMPTRDQAFSAALTGATMNTILPKVHSGLEELSIGLSRGLRWSIPLDLHLQQLAKAGAPIGKSETLQALANENPWARVQSGASADAALPLKNRIELTGNGENLPTIAHELFELKAREKSESEFVKAADALVRGEKALAREIFFAACESQERAARQVEMQVANQLQITGNKPSTNEISKQLSVGEKTYGDIWSAQFDQFVNTNGKSRPEIFFGGKSNYAEMASRIPSLSSVEKIALSKNLASLSEGTLQRSWNELVKDGDPAVRASAVENINVLPVRSVVNSWRALLNSNDPTTRRLAIAAIEKLPSSSRQECVNKVLERTDLNQHGAAELPTWAKSQFAKNAFSDMTDLAVKAIESIPGNADKISVWERALNSPDTSNAAIRNISVLPIESRAQAWQKSFAGIENGLSTGNRLQIDLLLDQLKNLPESSRVSAWQAFCNSEKTATPESIVKALTALEQSPDARKVHWQKIFERSQRSELDGEKRAAFIGESARSIEALAPEQRLIAWNEVFAKEGKAAGEQLTDALKSLPESDRLSAITKLLDAGNADLLSRKNSLLLIPSAELPAAARLIAARPDAHSLIKGFPIWNLDCADKNQASRNVASIIEAFGETKNSQVAELWNNVPEKHDPSTPDSYIFQRPIRDEAAGLIKPEILSEIVFAGDKVGEQISQSDPDIVRAIARNWQPECQRLSPVLVRLVQNWQQGTLTDGIKAIAPELKNILPDHTNQNTLVELAGLIADRSSSADRVTAMRELAQQIKSEQTSNFGLSLDVLARIGKSSPLELKNSILPDLQSKINNQAESAGYMSRLLLAREMARVIREGNLPADAIIFPSLKMPRIEDLSQNDRAILRTKVESALLNSDQTQLAALFNDGELGKLFPQIFGANVLGGFVGRPQVGEHEMPVDQHTLLVIQRVKENPKFSSLSQKDQLNLLWAALLHDTGKRPGVADPGHEWASANLGWGVLSTLDYDTTRIQRICNLVNYHSEASTAPNINRAEVLRQNPDLAQKIAVQLRHPSALDQVQILNEADIKSIAPDAKHWTPEVRAQLAEIANQLKEQRNILDESSVPLLTSKLPQGFGLHILSGDYALLAHISPYIDGQFLKQLPIIESPAYAGSASLITPGHKTLFDPNANFFAVFSGPAEHISAAARQNLSTGSQSTFADHQRLSFETNPASTQFANDLNNALRKLPQFKHEVSPIAALQKQLGQFDSLNELAKSGGTAYDAHLKVIQALTSTGDGKVLLTHNEVKMLAPQLTGFGIFRRGRNVVFEGAETTSRTLKGLDQSASGGLSPNPNGDALVIPRSLWQEAARRNIPLMIAD